MSRNMPQDLQWPVTLLEAEHSTICGVGWEDSIFGLQTSDGSGGALGRQLHHMSASEQVALGTE